MCRIMVSYIKPRENSEYLDLVKAFVSLSEHDVTLEKLSNGRFKSHSDGWGLAAIGLAGDKPVLMYHRYILPIYHDLSRYILNQYVERISRYDEAYLIIHSRLSSRGEPYGEKFNHPFEVIGSKHMLWFIHNGGVDKYGLSKLVGVNPILYTDSNIAAIYLSKNIDKCLDETTDVNACVEKAYIGLTKYISEKSALNTGLLVLHNDKPYLYASFYMWRNMDELRTSYYQLMSIEKNGLLSIISSGLRSELVGEMKLIEEGLYRLGSNGIEKISDLRD